MHVHVIFVAPYFMEITLRFLRGVLLLRNVDVSLISCQHVADLPVSFRAKLRGWERIKNPLAYQEIRDAVVRLEKHVGKKCYRLLGILEHLQEPLATVRDELGIEGMKRDVALNFRRKDIMKEKLRKAGLPCAKFLLATSKSEVVAFSKSVGFPIVIKPPAGVGTRATYRINDHKELLEICQLFPISKDKPWMLEEFITGDEYSFETVTINGKKVWYSWSRYYPTPLEAMEKPWIQWCIYIPKDIDTQEVADVKDVAFKALDVLGMDTGLSHMEWFRRKNGSVAISEIAARPPGAQITTLLYHAHEWDVYHEWAKLMVFREFYMPERKFAAGAAFLRGQGRGRVARIHGLDKAQRMVGDLVVEVRLPKIGQIKSASYEGEGYVVVKHPDLKVVKKALSILIQTLRVEMRE